MTSQPEGRPAHYADPDLVALYDQEGRMPGELDFQLALADRPRIAILDVGCGTGSLALEYAARGHDVTGLDPAVSMLAFASSKPGADRVHWELGDARNFDLKPKFDLITMTGHAFQTIVTDADIVAAATSFRKHLAPSGRVVFETRNPAVAAWKTWTKSSGSQRMQHPSLGPVEVYWEADPPIEPEIIAYAGHYHFLTTGIRKVSRDRLRFATLAKLQQLLATGGLTVNCTWGDWDGAPLASNSPEIIIEARHARLP